MFLDGLDSLDQEIVQLLIENARASYSEIGDKVGLSRVAVKSRIQALEQRGIIEEYTTIINPQKISGAVSCYFEIESLPETLAEITEILKQNETITQVYRVTGKDKLHVHAVASSNEEMEKLMHYEVGEAREQEDGSFVVPVTVEPADVYQTLEQHSYDVTLEMMERGEDPDAPEGFTEILAESMQRAMDGITYGEPVEVEIRVSQDGRGAYGISDEDMQKIADAMMPR